MKKIFSAVPVTAILLFALFCCAINAISQRNEPVPLTPILGDSTIVDPTADEIFLQEALSSHPKYRFTSSVPDTVPNLYPSGSFDTIRAIYLSDRGLNYDAIARNYLPNTYIYQKDQADQIDWMLFCPDDTAQCVLYQRILNTEVTALIKYRPGQTVYVRYETGHKSEAVKISTFDDFRSGAATFPALYLGNTVYYYINQRGFWYYLPESALYPDK